MKGSICWGTDGDNPGPEFNADGYVVSVDKAAFAQTDGQAGLASAAVAYADKLADVVPW